MTVQSLDDISRRRNGPAIMRRLRWLDGRLQWHASFQRNEFVKLFGISPQQASSDIASYQALAPGNARLDPADKIYRRIPGFKPLFDNDALVWLARSAEEGDPSVIGCESLLLPSRRVDDAIMAVLYEAYSGRTAMVIEYQSMTSRSPSERTICPHHIVDTGDRLHLRAWDDRRKVFADFVIGRIAAARPDPSYPWVDAVADIEWSETVKVVLGPADGLSPSQRSAVEMDYGMAGGKVSLVTRKALLVYLLERLGLLDSVRKGFAIRPGRGTRCLNTDELARLVSAWEQDSGC
jgi:hypothetical protein